VFKVRSEKEFPNFCVIMYFPFQQGTLKWDDSNLRLDKYLRFHSLSAGKFEYKQETRL